MVPKFPNARIPLQRVLIIRGAICCLRVLRMVWWRDGGGVGGWLRWLPRWWCAL